MLPASVFDDPGGNEIQIGSGSRCQWAYIVSVSVVSVIVVNGEAPVKGKSPLTRGPAVTRAGCVQAMRVEAREGDQRGIMTRWRINNSSAVSRRLVLRIRLGSAWKREARSSTVS